MITTTTSSTVLSNAKLNSPKTSGPLTELKSAGQNFSHVNNIDKRTETATPITEENGILAHVNPPGTYINSANNSTQETSGDPYASLAESPEHNSPDVDCNSPSSSTSSHFANLSLNCSLPASSVTLSGLAESECGAFICAAGRAVQLHVGVRATPGEHLSPDNGCSDVITSYIEYTHWKYTVPIEVRVETKDLDVANPTQTNSIARTVHFTLNRVGRYWLNIQMRGSHIEGSPFTLYCVASERLPEPKTQESSNNTNSSAKSSSGVRKSTSTKSESKGAVSRLSQTTRSTAAKSVILPKSSGTFYSSKYGTKSVQHNRPIGRDFFKSAGPGRVEASETCSVHGSTKSGSTSKHSNGAKSATSATSAKHSTRSGTASGNRNISERTNELCSIDEYYQMDDDRLLLQVGSRGRARGQFTNPQGIHCDPATSSIWTSDSTNQCVTRFSLSSGKPEFRFGTPGRSAGHTQRPTGIATSSGGDIVFVADYDNRIVNGFSAEDGALKTHFGCGKLLGPKGVAVVGDKILVVDNKGHQVLQFDPTGRAVQKFGSSNRARPWYFSGPHYLAVNDRVNRIYVTDFHGHSVKVFDMDMTFMFEFGTNGTGTGQFNAPTGITVDSKDNVLVADWGNSRIQIFDTTGSFVGFVESGQSLYGPQDVSITPNDHVIVADSGNHCFKIYEYQV